MSQDLTNGKAEVDGTAPAVLVRRKLTHVNIFNDFNVFFHLTSKVHIGASKNIRALS